MHSRTENAIIITVIAAGAIVLGVVLGVVTLWEPAREFVADATDEITEIMAQNHPAMIEAGKAMQARDYAQAVEIYDAALKGTSLTEKERDALWFGRAEALHKLQPDKEGTVSVWYKGKTYQMEKPNAAAVGPAGK